MADDHSVESIYNDRNGGDVRPLEYRSTSSSGCKLICFSTQYYPHIPFFNFSSTPTPAQLSSARLELSSSTNTPLSHFVRARSNGGPFPPPPFPPPPVGSKLRCPVLVASDMSGFS